MNKHEAVVLMAYTGTMLCTKDELREYAEYMLSRPVPIDELSLLTFLSELREISTPAVEAIIREVAE